MQCPGREEAGEGSCVFGFVRILALGFGDPDVLVPPAPFLESSAAPQARQTCPHDLRFEKP